MPVNTENVMKAFDLFNDGKFTDSEEMLRSEIKQARDAHLAMKLNLSGATAQEEEPAPEKKEESNPDGE